MREKYNFTVQEGNMPKEKKNEVKNVVVGNPTTQMGVMAVIVTTIVQPLVQVFHLGDTVTVLLALIVSFLCAFYHVRIVQELKKIESYILMVFATFIIFSTALGSNALIGKEPQAGAAGITEQKIKNLEEQIKNKDDLLKALGVESRNVGRDPARSGQLTPPDRSARSELFAKATMIFENEAFAQDNTTGSEDNKDKKKEANQPRKKDVVKAYLEKQKTLHQEREAIEKKEGDSKQTQNSLWKKW
jgi:hypothetical protein